MFNKLFATMSFANPAERARFEDMFNIYMSDIPDNFYVDQFSLAKKYPGTFYEDWVRILKHPAFNTWKSEQIAIIATTLSSSKSVSPLLLIKISSLIFSPSDYIIN